MRAPTRLLRSHGGWLRHHVLRPAGRKHADVGYYNVQEPLAGRAGRPGDVRRDVAVLGCQERMVGRGRLDGEHVQTGPRDLPGNGTAAKAGSSTSGPRLVLINTAVRFMSDRRSALTSCRVSGVNGQCRLMASLWLKSVARSTAVTFSMRGGDDVGSQHLHAERQGQSGHRLTDASEADDAHRAIGQFRQRKFPVAPVDIPRPAPAATERACSPTCCVRFKRWAKTIWATESVP